METTFLIILEVSSERCAVPEFVWIFICCSCSLLLAAVLVRALAVNKSSLALIIKRELLPEFAVIAFVHHFCQSLSARAGSRLY